MGKELTPQLIKKLEENANLMMSKGFSEADIQDMSAQFIEEFGVEKVVKKKEDTIKSGSGFSMLSGTESKSKSPEPSKPTQSQTKAINTNPTMPDFGLKLGFPIQKPTINLKTTEQEQRIIKSKESNQTPQVFEDYRTVLQKGIQGQNKIDATFTPLSKPIIESQAKKEVQHLKEQQQATKLAKKETHQNINAVIPELAQAKNTDEAISTILKSDMKDNIDMWQQFDDNTLLNNDESTLNDFLVKKGLKNADREAYLKGQSESNPKYQYEYERNNISSLFGAVAQRAKDYEDVLKNKFGDNYLQQANAGNENILNDTEFNTFISLKEKEKSLSTKANSLINDPRFSSIKKELDKNEDKQLKSDAIAKADKWYNPTDELRYVGSKVLYAAGKAVKMLAELPSLATSTDKGYDWTDKLADWGDRFSTDLIDAIPVSTDLKAGFNNKVAKVGNYKVIIDDNGEVADVRDNNNFKVSLDEMKSVTDKYNANPKGYKVNNEYNPRSLADNGLNTVIDMGLMILGTKGAGVLGAGKKMQKLTSMGIAYQQTKRDVFNDALKKGLDPRNADLLANIIGVVAGTSSSINPLEYNIASGKGLFNFLKTDGLNAGKLALIKEGKLSVKDYAKEFVKAGIKNTIGENIEELGIENTTRAIANNYFDNKISATDEVDGGLDEKLHIFDKQGLETFLITAGTSFLMTPIEMKSQMLGNQQEALKLAIDNPIDFKKIRQIQVEKGQLTQDEVDKEAKIYEDVSRTYNASKDEIKEELKPQLLALLTKKYNIANKINEIKDDVLSAPYKAQLNDINKGIQDITNGIIPNESLVENTVTTTSVDDNNQEQEQEQDTDNNTNQSTIIGQAAGKGGVSILTKEKIRIANKISKGEDLTPEESDFYKAVKEDIDKIIAGSITPTQQTTTSKLDNDVRLIEITPEDRKELPKQFNTAQRKEYINLSTKAEQDEYLLKFKKKNEQVKTTPTESIESGQEQNDGSGVSKTQQNNQGVQQKLGLGQDNNQEVPTEKVEEGVGETESIKNRSRKDLFPDESEFSDVIGGSGKNSKISSYKEVNGIGISEYKNPDSGVVDVIMTGTSDNDYVGYVRIYENGKPTERWTSKMENKSGNKANFKTMISEVKNLLPANHEYTESTNISLDGIRVYANNLTRGYEILTDKDGNPITNNVELNGATLQGLKDAKSDRDVSKLYNKRTGITRDEFNKIREKVNELLSGTRLLFNEANGSVIIKLPVLKSKETAKSNPRIAELPKKKEVPTEKVEEGKVDKALRDVESTAKALDGSSLKGIVFADKNGVEKIVVQDNKGGGFLIKNNDGKPQNPTMGNHKDISEAYHKAKADGSNPELVKAVEGLLGKPTEKVEEVINDKRGEKPNGYYIDTAKLQEDGTSVRIWEEAENAKPITGYEDIGLFSHKVGDKVVISENKTGKKIVEANSLKEAKDKLKELIVKNGGEQSFKDKVNNPVSEVAKLKEKEQKNSQNNTKFDNNVTKSTDKTKTIDTTTESGVRENTESSTEEKSEEKGANTKPTKSRVKGTPKSRRKVKHPEYLRALSHEPETATDIVLQAFISGAKIKADIIKKLYRNSGREIKQRIGLLSNGGYSTMAEMAHRLWEDQESFFGFEKFDSQEFENAIEDVLNSHTGTRSMVDELNNKFGLTADEKDAEEYAKYQEYEQKAEQEDLDEAIVYYESLTEEELLEIANAKDSAFIDDYVTYAEGKNNELAEERKQPADRTAKEIEAELKVKNAELKKLEEKQSKLNAQLEKNLKENQLDLLQGAKPQSMFDDKVEQQKVAESLKNDIDKKRKEVAKLQDELDNINQEEIPFQSTDKKFTTITEDAFTKLLDKLKKAFPNVKVELFGKGNMESAKKALEKYGVDLDLQSIYNIIGLSVLATSSTSQINQQPLITNAVSDNLNLSDGNVVEINDNRLIDKASGNKITDKNKMSASVTEGDIKKLTLLSNKHGVDPYTMIAMTMQETNFDTGLENPFHYDPQNWEKYKGISEDPMEIAVLVFKDKLKYAERLGKKTEAEKIQAYNGYGKIGKKTDAQKGSSVRSWYGISSSSFPIDMNKTPIYGNRVLDIRDNIIKSNPKIVKLVESQSNNIAFLKTKDGTIYGFKTPDGKVFINTDQLNANTPIHEFAHVWQEVFPQGFARGIELLKLSPQGQALIKEIQKNPAYKGKSLADIQAEALVTAIGNKGETIFNSNPTLWNRFKEWLSDFFKKIGEKLGIKNLSPDDKFDMFTKKVVGELLGGKVLDSKVGTEKSTEKTITFQGQNIKVKEINGGAEVVNGFYSPLEKIINETKFEKLPAKQWVDKFAKGEEAKWTGLTDWLNQQQGSVSKADIQQYLKNNRIQVVEVVKDDVKKFDLEIKKSSFGTWDVVHPTKGIINSSQTEALAKNWIDNYAPKDITGQDTKFSQYQLEGEKENYKEVLVTMPVAKSKQEYVVEQDYRTPNTFYAVNQKTGVKLKFGSYELAKSQAERLSKESQPDFDKQFKSSHFDEPNILVHLRMNTRTDAEGNKVLFLEEVQSDWGQKGKKEGFKDSEASKKEKLLYDLGGDYIAVRKGYGVWSDATKEQKQNELNRIKNRLESNNLTEDDLVKSLEKWGDRTLSPMEGTPTAPFITDTNAWTKLGLKIALKEAVKQGADKIAWTTGEQQNDRYDLSKQVQSIEVEKVEEVPNLFFVDINMLNETATYNLEVENGIVREGTYKGQRLEDVVGKDVAEKILNGGSQTLRGDNLKVGGKGMKGFYGSPTEGSLGIVGNVAKSLFKQEPKTVEIEVSNSQVDLDTPPRIMKLKSGEYVVQTPFKDSYVMVDGEMENPTFKDLSSANEFYINETNRYNKEIERTKSSTQHSIDITPEMKAEVETGMPLFQYRKSELQSAVDAMRNDGMTDEEIRKFLDAIEQPKEEIDSVLEKQPKEKEKRLLNKAFKGTIDEELKSFIEDYGLTYDTEDQIIAEEEANDIINEVGLEKAFQAVQNGYINGAQAAVVYAKMVDHIEAQLQKGNLSDEELVKLKNLQAYTIDIFDNAARDAGRFIAMLKRVYHKSLFTYDAMVKSAENAKGTPLTEEERLLIKEQSEKIAELDKTIKELEEKLEQERAENAVQKIKADNNKPKPTSVSFKAKGKAFADKIRGLKTKGLVLKDADGNPINLTQNSIITYNDIIEMIARTIEKTGEILDGIDTALNEIKKQDWYEKLSQRDKDAVDKQIKQDILDLDDDVSDDKFKIPHSLIREIVKNGTEDIDGIVKKVLEVYHDIYPDLDERKVRDIITKYGEQKIDTRDDIDKKISEAKRIGRHLSGKEDLLNGKPPKRSGFKRDKPTPTERLLMQEIQQLLKNIPKSQEEIDNLWTTALEKAKTRITNRIEELQLAIDKKERINKTKNVQNYNDPDLDKLKDDLKAKQKEYDDLFPKEKTELSDEQRLILSVNAKKKQLKTLQSQKDSKVYERNKKDAPDRSKFPKLDKEIKDLDDKIKGIKEEIKQDDSWVKHIEKKRISLAIKANQRRIEEYRRMINEKDFVVVKNPTPISDELTKVRRERQKVADEYELAKYKHELENRTLGQKIFDGIFEGLQLSKQFVATADLSAPLRQGGTVIFSNPIIWAKAFVDMHGQAFSHQTYKDTIDAIKNSKYYDLAQDSKLAITDADSINERKREEQFVSKLMDSNFMKKAPILAQYRQINKGSERAYSGFLNNIRFNLFEKGAKELEQAGYTFSDNPKMYKALATTINNLTGRGWSPSGNEGKLLNFVLFSPKMLTSRVLLMYDLLRTDIPLNSPSRKMAAKSLLGTAAWISIFNILGTMAVNALDDDDDKEEKVNINPIATDFIKVRSKQTTFDPTAGYAPLVRTLSRIIAGKSVNSSGKEKDLSKGYGQTRFSPFWDFMENKLSPIASYGLSLLTHKNPQNKFEDASKAEWNDYITPLFVPLQAMLLVENFNDKDSFGKDFIETVLSLYGIGVAQYDNTSKGNKNANSQTGNRRTERDNTARTTNRRTER